MANNNNTLGNVSLLINGTAGWNALVSPRKSNYQGADQYLITVENPTFADQDGNTDPNTMDPTAAAMIQKIQSNPKILRPGNQQYPNPSVIVSLTSTRQDGTVQKPRYFDRKTNAEIPVKNNIATGQPISVVANATDNTSSVNGLKLYLQGIIFDDASKPGLWYQANNLLAGFKTLPTDGQAGAQVTSNDFNSGATPFGNTGAAPQQPAAPTQPASPFGNNVGTPQAPTNEPVQPAAAPQQPAAPTQPASPFGNNTGAAPQADPFGNQNNNGTTNPFGNANNGNNPFAK